MRHLELSEKESSAPQMPECLSVSASCSAGVREATGQLAAQAPGMDHSSCHWVSRSSAGRPFGSLTLVLQPPRSEDSHQGRQWRKRKSKAEGTEGRLVS